MITAVDSNILIDVFGANRTFGLAAKDALKRCRREGRLVVCEVVWAEVAGRFAAVDRAGEALTHARVDFDPMDEEAAAEAGIAWHRYREQGGRRERVISDFLIGAHALARADRLLTRDRGFYRSYFSKLKIIEP